MMLSELILTTPNPLTSALMTFLLVSESSVVVESSSQGSKHWNSWSLPGKGSLSRVQGVDKSER